MASSMHVHRGDKVRIIAGKENGREGKILRAYPEKQRVTVEGANMIKRATRPSQKNPQGGIIEKEAPLHISNVMLYDPKAKRGTRVRIQARPDGARERISVVSGESLPKGE